MEKESKQKKNMKEKLLQKKVIIPLIILAAIIIGCSGILFAVSDKPAFCSTCHIMKPYYQSYSEGDLLAYKHAAGGVDNCHDCHEEDLATKVNEGIKYVTGDYKTPLDKRNFATKQFCLECHDFNKIKAATAFEESNPHDSHNGEQQCYECHSMHGQSKVMCSQCHSFDWMSELDGSWK